MRLRTVIAFGAGYVLGARAGRERYEQLKRWFDKAVNSEPGQRMVANGRDLMGSSLDAASQQLRRLAE